MAICDCVDIVGANGFESEEAFQTALEAELANEDEARQTAATEAVSAIMRLGEYDNFCTYMQAYKAANPSEEPA